MFISMFLTVKRFFAVIYFIMFKKIIIALSFSIFFLSGCFYFASFFVSKTIIVNSSFKPDNGSATSLSVPVIEAIHPLYLTSFTDVKKAFLTNKIDWLEVNLPKMEIIVWQQGEIIKKVSILKLGNTESWGGTAAGLYEVLAKYRVAWSGAANVNMPYAIHFYGKYYIHGEPYYPNGQKLISDISGGCISLKNEDAETLYDLAQKEMPVLVIDKEYEKYEYSSQGINNLSTVSAQSFLVADMDSGFIFGTKNSAEEYSIASLTKLMTSVVVAENVNLNKSITITPTILEAYGSNEKLVEGEKFGVVELFYPFLIESCNDAGEALAAYMGREKTIAQMNEKARHLLMGKTVFTCPTGYDQNNVSTAQDLFQLARYILNNRPSIFKITRGEKVPSFGKNRFLKEDLWNKNIFADDSSFVGGKTGYLPQIKNNGLFIFRFLTEKGDKKNIAIIVLNSENGKKDTQIIYKWLMENYSLSPDYQS